MSDKHHILNRTTQLLGKLFPVLLVFTPIISHAATIDQSTSVPQDFSSESEYIINKNVTISSLDNVAAVTVSGMDVTSVTNNGKITAKADGLDINTKEGANKQVISSQADSLIKISRIWADFFPANTSNQPI